MDAIAVAPESQQARSRETRRRLVAACIAALVERGLARTSTSEVCRRAGVSQGALFKHFPTKQALFAATIEALFAGLVADYRRALAQPCPGGDRLAVAVELLWEIFRRPALQAAFELMVAARTDAPLRAALEAVQARHREQLLRAARELFPRAAAEREDFAAALDVVLSAMQGASLGALVLADPEADADRVAFLTDLARRVFAPEAAA
jgi:AcrR family transcriptional regulator